MEYSTAPNAQIVGVYFSASYCKWCTTFTPKLATLFPYLRQYNVDVVLAGCDKTEEAYVKYHSYQPWSALPFGDEAGSKMRELYGIKTIPALVFLDQDGNVVARDGRDIVDRVVLNGHDGSLVDAQLIASQLGASSLDYASDASDF